MREDDVAAVGEADCAESDGDVGWYGPIMVSLGRVAGSSDDSDDE